MTGKSPGGEAAWLGPAPTLTCTEREGGGPGTGSPAPRGARGPGRGRGEGERNDYNGTAVNEHTFKYQPDLRVPPS